MAIFGGYIFIFQYLSCFVLILLPIIFHWDPIISTISREKLPIYYALQSTDYKITLYCSLAISLPMVLQLMFRICIKPSILLSFYSGASNAILVTWIIATDTIILFVVIPQQNIIIYSFIVYLRVISLIWSVGMYLYLYSESSIWRSQITIGTFIVMNSTRVISFYAIFFNISHFLLQVNSILMGVSYIVLLVQCLRWFYNTRKNHITKQMSMKETFCGIYVFSMVGATISGFCIFGYYRNVLWYQSDGSNLSAQTIAYTIFYLIFAVFQGNAYERDAQSSRVALEVKQLFIRYMSHELRTPLNTVMMGLQHLKEEIKKPGDDKILNLEEVVEEIQESCNVALRTLNDMLLHDKIEAGSLALESENVRVVPLIQDVVKELQLQARQFGVKLSISFLNICHENTSNNYHNNNNMTQIDWSTLLVSADSTKLSQVFRNIISNGLKFTPRNGSVNVRITKVIDNPQFHFGAIKIEVVDTGIGISLVNQPKLFDGVIQFLPGKIQQGGGSGLGLFISKGFMDAHHGSLTVSSEGEGKGSTFTILLPLLSPMALVTEPVIQCISPRIGLTSSGSIHPLYAEDISLMRKVSEEGEEAIGGDSGVVEDENLETHTQKLNLFRGSSSFFNLSPPSSSVLAGGGNPDAATIASDMTIDFTHRRKMSEKCDGEMKRSDVAQPSLGNSKKKPVILVVDDIASNRKMLRRLLVDRCDYTIDAVDGQDAVEKVREAMSTGTTIDVITMDYQMPVMDGLTATRKIRELGYSGIILGVTGNVLPVDIGNFITAGANRVLTKPLNIKTFDATLLELSSSKK